MKNIEQAWPEIEKASREIHAEPETRFKEFESVRRLTGLLSAWGFDVEIPYGGLETAFRANYGKGKPVFAFTAEYDALPGIGHACGHNLISAVSLAAALQVASRLESESIEGQVCVIGTPGEEMGGGKVLLLRNGAFDGVDAVMQAHPTNRNVTDPGTSGVVRYDISFKGVAAHSAAAPEEGRNALDAVMLLFQGINAWRQHLPEDCRVHGVVTDGGDAPNIVPAHASCCFYLRSINNDVLDQMQQRLKDIARGAALMTGTEETLELVSVPYKAGAPNPVLNRALIEESAKRGITVSVPEAQGRSSSDFGDVSEALPAIQARFNICREGQSAKLHSDAFREFAITDHAFKRSRETAEILADIAWRFLSESEFRNEVLNARNA